MLYATLPVLKLAIREDGDLYHLHDPELLITGQLLRLFKKKVVFDMHENLPKALLTKYWIPSHLRVFISTLFKCIQRVLLQRVYIIFAEKSYSEEYNWARDSEVVLNMPLVEHLNSVQATKYAVTTIGYLGAISEGRGLLSMVDAVRTVRNVGFDVQCIIIGADNNNLKGLIENSLRDNGVWGYVNLLGYLPGPHAWQHIAKCHIGFALLKREPNYVQSYPTKIFEYMALGIPVVASNFPLYRSVIEKYRCGICVDPDDIEEISSAIIKLISKPDLAESMGRAGKAAVKRYFNWENEKGKLIAFYDKVLSSR
jgi:glycosyltransferase involved in cell wall biosynthesis